MPLKGGSRWLRTTSLILLAVLLGARAQALRAEPATLSIEIDGRKRTFSTAELLARSATRMLRVPRDPAYDRPMRYLAIPLSALLQGLPSVSAGTIEARATDGFVSQLPGRLIEQTASGGAVAWIAIEDPAHPWPSLPRKSHSAGPFYLVWEHPGRSGIVSEQWPYALASLTAVPDPLRRWPQLSIAADVSADDPSRHGQAVFLVQCLPCHRLYGAGAGEQGPDLGLPMPATAYMTQAGLKALLRDPSSVRTWPRQQMPSFDPVTLPDGDIDAVIAYLRRIADQRR